MLLHSGTYQFGKNTLVKPVTPPKIMDSKRMRYVFSLRSPIRDSRADGTPYTRRCAKHCAMWRTGSRGFCAGISLTDAFSIWFCFVFCCRDVVKNVLLRIFGLLGEKTTRPHLRVLVVDCYGSASLGGSEKMIPATYIVQASAASSSPGRSHRPHHRQSV